MGYKMDMVAHACDPSTQGAEAGEPLWVPDQPRYQGKSLSQNVFLTGNLGITDFRLEL